MVAHKAGKNRLAATGGKRRIHWLWESAALSAEMDIWGNPAGTLKEEIIQATQHNCYVLTCSDICSYIYLFRYLGVFLVHDELPALAWRGLINGKFLGNLAAVLHSFTNILKNYIEAKILKRHARL